MEGSRINNVKQALQSIADALPSVKTHSVLVAFNDHIKSCQCLKTEEEWTEAVNSLRASGGTNFAEVLGNAHTQIEKCLKAADCIAWLQDAHVVFLTDGEDHVFMEQLKDLQTSADDEKMDTSTEKADNDNTPVTPPAKMQRTSTSRCPSYFVPSRDIDYQSAKLTRGFLRHFATFNTIGFGDADESFLAQMRTLHRFPFAAKVTSDGIQEILQSITSKTTNFVRERRVTVHQPMGKDTNISLMVFRDRIDDLVVVSGTVERIVDTNNVGSDIPKLHSSVPDAERAAYALLRFAHHEVESAAVAAAEATTDAIALALAHLFPDTTASPIYKRIMFELVNILVAAQNETASVNTSSSSLRIDSVAAGLAAARIDSAASVNSDTVDRILSVMSREPTALSRAMASA